ncbi:MAG: hypothetical protein J7M10_00435 [Candidatus Cloacimonetes bacterium]|nr:hypothetical protein [Candidatus Cloacimonadota bacterium]
MSILSHKNSMKEKPAHNFSQKIAHPSSVMIVCSADFVEFLESLWGLGILLQSYKNTLIVLHKKEWISFVNKLYPDRDFSFIEFSELGAAQDVESLELIIFLTKQIQKDVNSFLKKTHNAVIAGMSSFSDIKVLNCIVSVNELQSYYYQFFSFALQITGTSEKWDVYIRNYNFQATRDTKSSEKGIIYVDISPGIHGTRLLRKHIYSLVNALQKSYKYDVVLLDWDARYYDKLVFNKCAKPDFQLIVSHEQALEVLKSCELFISPNSTLLHLMRYTPLRTFSILVPHERRHHCETSKNRTHITHTFAGLRIKDILPEIKKLLQ